MNTTLHPQAGLSQLLRVYWQYEKHTCVHFDSREAVRIVPEIFIRGLGLALSTCGGTDRWRV